jgi:ABC-2 type transport system ATP-binding protein
MDEAERCHRIAYLAYGKLLLEGTVDDVVAGSGLTTWQAAGDDIATLQHDLRGKPGIEMAAAFGNALHVTGSDRAALDQAIAPFRADPRWRWQEITPSLEDVFIHTMIDQVAA